MTPGIDKAPGALRDAGLVRRLQEIGSKVEDLGDVAASRWRPDPSTQRAHNLGEVTRVAARTCAVVERVVRSGDTPLVLGGDCTVTVGVVAGVANARSSVALLYVDGGPDLYTPDGASGAHLDSTGVAHLLALPRHEPSLAGIGSRSPLLTPNRFVSYGDSVQGDDDLEVRLLRELGIARVSADEVHADRVDAAARALEAVETVADAFVLHVDVDVLDFNDVPLADIPNAEGQRVGLTRDELMDSVRTFAGSSSCAAVVLTEVNPDHAPDAESLPHFAERFAEALAGE
jgi:arginase